VAFLLRALRYIYIGARGIRDTRRRRRLLHGISSTRPRASYLLARGTDLAQGDCELSRRN